MSEDINPEIQQYITNLNRRLETAENEKLKMGNQLSSIMQYTNEKENNLVEYQLSFEKDLNEMYHLLSGHETQIVQEAGVTKEIWIEPKDDRLKTFSTYGVKKIMNLLKMYVNRNTLLSNYGEEEIKATVWTFGIELSDLFGTKYQEILYYPSPEELYDKHKPIVKEKKLDISEEELYNKCVKWSEEELNRRIKEIPVYFWSMVHMVNSAFKRAWGGKERQSLGERGININQTGNNLDLPIQPQKKGGFFGLLK